MTGTEYYNNSKGGSTDGQIMEIKYGTNSNVYKAGLSGNSAPNIATVNNRATDSLTCVRNRDRASFCLEPNGWAYKGHFDDNQFKQLFISSSDQRLNVHKGSLHNNINSFGLQM